MTTQLATMRFKQCPILPSILKVIEWYKHDGTIIVHTHKKVIIVKPVQRFRGNLLYFVQASD